MPEINADKTYALFASPINKKIISEIENAGAKIVLFPNVETKAVQISAQVENQLKDLSDFDWIIFPDIYAVDYFLQTLEKLEIDFFELDALRVCAFSETIADRLRFSQIHSDVISNRVKAETVLQVLRNYEPDFSNLKFLVPKEKETNLKLTNELIKYGARILEFAVYFSSINEISELSRLKALLKGGAIDEFIFSSPEDAANFSLLFQVDDFSSFLNETTALANDSLTYNALREFGLSRIKYLQ